MLLKESQEFHLQGQGQLADFVKKQRPAGGGFDAARPLNVRAGKSPFFMTKQLAFQQVFRDGAAIDGDKGAVLARAATVNGQRGHFLSRAAFSQNQYRHRRGRHLSNRRKHFLHQRAGAEHALEGVAAQTQLHFPVLLFQPGDVEGPFEHRLEFLHLNRLAEKIVGPLSDRAQGGVPFRLAADNDNLRQGILCQQLGQRRQALIRGEGGRGQSQVQDDHQRPMGAETVDRAGAILGQEHLILICQRPFHLGADLLIVINNQQF